MCTRKGYAASISRLVPATAALYFPLLIRKASPNGAACFVIYKERNHKTSLILNSLPFGQGVQYDCYPIAF